MIKRWRTEGVGIVIGCGPVVVSAGVIIGPAICSGASLFIGWGVVPAGGSYSGPVILYFLSLFYFYPYFISIFSFLSISIPLFYLVLYL